MNTLKLDCYNDIFSRIHSIKLFRCMNIIWNWAICCCCCAICCAIISLKSLSLFSLICFSFSNSSSFFLMFISFSVFPLPSSAYPHNFSDLPELSYCVLHLKTKMTVVYNFALHPPTSLVLVIDIYISEA